MFTTGVHLYFYIAGALYLASAIMLTFKRDRVSRLALAAGILIHGLYLIGRGWLGGDFIPNPIVEGPYLLPWCIAVITLIVSLISKRCQWWILLVPLLLFTAAALFYAKGIIPPTPKKLTLWAIVFFISEVLAHACFYSGAAYAAHSLYTGKQSETIHRLIVIGFILYSVAQVTGAVWCYIGWGNTFRWGSRHMNSAAIWLTYAAYLHIRYIPALSTKWRYRLALFGAAITLFASYSVYIHEMFFPRIGG